MLLGSSSSLLHPVTGNVDVTAGVLATICDQENETYNLRMMHSQFHTPVTLIPTATLHFIDGAVRLREVK
jgi:hypothetical protein